MSKLMLRYTGCERREDTQAKCEIDVNQTAILMEWGMNDERRDAGNSPRPIKMTNMKNIDESNGQGKRCQLSG